MTSESTDGIARSLKLYRNFEECILEDIRWRHHGTVLEFVFDYMWTADGSIRSEFAGPNWKVIAFRNVQEFHLRNALNEQMSLHPEQLNWGLSEVASVQVVEDEAFLERYQTLPIPLHHVRCLWEGERRVDVVFSTMEVFDR